MSLCALAPLQSDCLLVYIRLETNKLLCQKAEYTGYSAVLKGAMLYRYASMTMEDLCRAYARKRAGAIAACAALEPEPANKPLDGKQVRPVRRAAFPLKLPCHAAKIINAQSAAGGMQCHLPMHICSLPLVFLTGGSRALRIFCMSDLKLDLLVSGKCSPF